MKTNWFLAVFSFIFVFFISSSPVFASQPTQKCIETRWFATCIPIPLKPTMPTLPSIKPRPTPSPTSIVIGANLKDYKKPHKKDCNITVPSQFSTIQSAVDAAASGDTICVSPGTFNESVFINKSIRLSGSGASKSFINGQNVNGAVAIFSGSNIIVEGFSMQGQASSNALLVGEASYVIVQYNRIVSGNGGIALLTDSWQKNNIVQNNILVGNNSPYVARADNERVDFFNNTFNGTANPSERSDTGFTLVVVGAGSLIKQNSFNTTGNMIALIAPSGTNIINENNFNSTITLKVANGNPTTVNAKNNWWGDLDPSDNIQGSVDFIPFAISPFAEN